MLIALYSRTTSLQRRHWGRNGNTNGQAEFCLNVLAPQEAGRRRQKQIEEVLKVAEASRSKVMEWRKSTDVDGS